MSEFKDADIAKGWIAMHSAAKVLTLKMRTFGHT
jgi:hypothetical protein